MHFFGVGVAEDVFQFLEEGRFHLPEVLLELLEGQERPAFFGGVDGPARGVTIFLVFFHDGVVVDELLGAAWGSPPARH